MTDAEALVCVVDDDAALRESLQDLLGSVRLRVAAFASAQEFLHSPRPEVPSCLVLDVRLPGLSGLELQQRLAAQSLERLFEAFYTTKPQGLGLGLAISRRIIEAHGGRLWATANVPHGAVLQFTVPIGNEGVT